MGLKENFFPFRKNNIFLRDGYNGINIQDSLQHWNTFPLVPYPKANLCNI